MQTSEEIKKVVKEKYGEIAAAKKAEGCVLLLRDK